MNWQDYVQETAHEYGVPYDIASELFSMFGPSEAYEGFIRAMEDAARELEGWEEMEEIKQ